MVALGSWEQREEENLKCASRKRATKTSCGHHRSRLSRYRCTPVDKFLGDDGEEIYSTDSDGFGDERWSVDVGGLVAVTELWNCHRLYKQ
jgi:hypothetical protein